jgi:diacylglycerol kinase family enzyme
VVRRQPRVPRMETFRAARVEVTSNRVQAREIDGDVIEPSRRLLALVRPMALTVCMPRVEPEGHLAADQLDA